MNTETVRQRLGRHVQSEEALAAILPHLETALTRVALPNHVLTHFERLLHGAPQAEALLQHLAAYPRAVEKLVTLFASSQFLSEILLQHPEYIPRLTRREEITRPYTAADLYAQLREALPSLPTHEERVNALRTFQRWHLLRIGACDLWDFWDLNTVTRQLSDLAEALVRAALDLAAEQTDTPLNGFVVLALGKLGGRELNYSSDIDLLFLAQEHPSRYVALGKRLIDILSRITDEGFLYRVDMRLRPWGSTGPLVTSVEGYLTYLQRHARLWEKQALLKARPIAGDRALGAAFVRRLPPLIFENGSLHVRESVREMKERIEEELQRRGQSWGEVKLGEGSIRDVEFIVQYLQLIHGKKHPHLRTGNTRKALDRLHASGLLPTDEYRVLVEGYTFLRTVEHHLQLMHNQQTHRLPENPEQIAHLARRLGYTGPDAAQRLITHYEDHRKAIRTVYCHHLGNNYPPAHMVSRSKIEDHVARMAPSYAQAFTEGDIRRHAALAARLSAENPVEVEAIPLSDNLWRVTIVGYDYLGELSLITGLLFVYGFSILEGQVFTYERDISPGEASSGPRKIVDVFTVTPVSDAVAPDTWTRYQEDLRALLRRLAAGDWEDAHGELAYRFAQTLAQLPDVADVLYPVDITIDNTTSDRYTILRIEAPDTVGFLYEFTNALALQGIYIARVDVVTEGASVRDTLWVTDTRGRKITTPEKQQELRAATVLVKQFTHILPRAPDPKSALLHFRTFLRDLFARPHWVEELASLQRREVLDALARLLGVSEFLWDDFLRIQHEQIFPVLKDVDALVGRKSKATLWFELTERLERASESPRDVLNTFKDREMFRIDMRYILGHATFDEFSAELTDLAEVIVERTYRLCRDQLVARYGEPLRGDGTPARLAVCGLGKLGGREMGFASDIELMFVYDDNGQTTGPRVISTAEFYERLVACFLHILETRREGIFEVDLQLRPYGKAGSLAVARRAFAEYFRPGGPAWPYERQALVRLRAIGGDLSFGREVELLRDTLIYTGVPFDVAAMRAMRERQLRHLVKGGTINAKFSPGGLVDVEYLVQALQITYGHPYPELRTPNTAEAMHRLAALRILSPEDYRRLREAHHFLRVLIEALRVVRGQAKDLTVPPRDSDAFAFLARRMGYGRNTAALWHDLTRHMNFVRDLNERLL